MHVWNEKNEGSGISLKIVSTKLVAERLTDKGQSMFYMAY